MKDFLKGEFYNPTQGNMKIDQVIDELINYIFEKPDKTYNVIVGCDSSSSETPDFPLVVVALRIGEGGRFFLKKIGYQNRIFHSWKERILEEVLLSCEFALYLRENFENRMKIRLLETNSADPNYQLCYIHADVGENGKTRDMIKEVIGLIKGNGFEPVIKPGSFAASSVADRYS